MHKREKQNYQILTSKGEISEQRRLENDTAQKLYDKLLSNTSTLAVSTTYVYMFNYCMYMYMYMLVVTPCVCVCVCVQELLDEDMPDLPEFVAPQEQSDISIELQFPSGIADVRES